jgi:putative hemolysin
MLKSASMVTPVLLRVFVVLLLVAANAFFVAAEFALVSVRETRLQQMVAAGRLGARTVLRLRQHLDLVLAGVQLGVTLASLGLGWIGEATVAQYIEAGFSHVPHITLYAHGIAVAVAFAGITFVLVTLGEIVPKSIALHRAERVAISVAAPMDVFIRLTRPFLYFISRTSAAMLRAFGTHPVFHAGVHSAEELKLMIGASGKLGILPETQSEMVGRALELGDVAVREIMVPRPSIFSLPADMPLEEAIPRVIEEQRSRVPVFDPRRGREHIVGVLYSKDLSRFTYQRLRRLEGGRPPAPSGYKIADIMRDVLFVPETKTLTDLLVEFKQRRRHLAVVVDEFGSTVGVVTVEDVLEQLVGEIEDEFDVAQRPAFAAGSPVMVLEGAANIRDLENEYDLRLPRDLGFETLGGFVTAQLQRIPRSGDSFDFDGRRYSVLQMDGRRVGRVKIELLPAPRALERAGS